MISTTYLIIITCISVLATDIPTVFSNCCMNSDDNKNIYNLLDEAEHMIKSAKGKLSTNAQKTLPMDCGDLLRSGINESGVYWVWPRNRFIPGCISVYCDMDTDGGGWTVIQRRGNFGRAKDYFYKDWKAYKEGFGNLEKDFWLGNDYIYALTNQGQYSIRFDLGDFDGKKAYAVFDTFWIEDENRKYKLHVSSYSGNAGDSFIDHDGMKFTTKDNDNDISGINCAELWKGAWWYKICHPTCLNGEYHIRKPPHTWQGIIWYKWKGADESLAMTEMKIRKTASWIK